MILILLSFNNRFMKNAFLIVLILILGCQTKKTEIKHEVLTQKVDKYKNIVSGRYNVAFLIMDGTYNTELTAPFDIFQHTFLEKI